MTELAVPVPWALPDKGVGMRDETAVPLGSVMWFDESFLEEQIIECPGCTWRRDGNFVKQIVRKGYERPGRPNGKVWELTGEWRVWNPNHPEGKWEFGQYGVWQMKAVWPD